MITEIRFPVGPDRYAFLERNRKHNDFAVINVAVVGRRDGGGRWSDLRIALGGVNDRAVLAAEAARAAGGHGAAGRCDRRGRAVGARGGRPAERRAGLREYRRHLVPVYVAARWPSSATMRWVVMPEQVDVTINVNGRDYRRQVEARMHLADFLRHELGLTGTHIGCEQGVCGNCTVLVDGQAIKSCLMFAPRPTASG